MKELEVLTVRLPKDIVEWLDYLVEKGVYNSRAEAIREFCREYVSNSKSAKKGDFS